MFDLQLLLAPQPLKGDDGQLQAEREEEISENISEEDGNKSAHDVLNPMAKESQKASRISHGKQRTKSGIANVEIEEREMLQKSDIEFSENEEEESNDDVFLMNTELKTSRKQGTEEDETKGGAEDFINWSFEKEPTIPERPFTGVSGPQHTLDPLSSTQFHYFSLFIPLFFFERFAAYTNTKPEIEAKRMGMFVASNQHQQLK